LLPPAKRYLPNGDLMLRVRWWQYLFQPLVATMTKYTDQRKLNVLKANVTTELIVFQNYLRHITNDNALVVVPPSESGIYVSLNTSVIPNGVFVGKNNNGVFIGTKNTASWQILYTTANILLIERELQTYIIAGFNCEVKQAT